MDFSDLTFNLKCVNSISNIKSQVKCRVSSLCINSSLVSQEARFREVLSQTKRFQIDEVLYLYAEWRVDNVEWMMEIE